MAPDEGPDMPPDEGPDMPPDEGPDMPPDEGPDMPPDEGPNTVGTLRVRAEGQCTVVTSEECMLAPL